MKPGIVLAAALLAAGPAPWAETVDQVVAKNLKARGGVERLKSIQSVRMSGTLTLGSGTEARISMEFLRPAMVRTEYTLRGMTAIQAFDGRVAWQVVPFSGKTEAQLMTGEDRASMEDQADVEGELVDWKAKGLTVDLVGRETVGGVDAWKLRITREGRAVKTMWLDAASYLEAREESERTVDGKPEVWVTTLSDYRDVAGRMVPFVTESRPRDGTGSQRITLATVEFDVPIDAARFRMPEPKPGAPPAPPR
jgi:hypothetical protein